LRREMERRLGVFESRGVKNIFGLKRDEIDGDWRRLHNEELVIFISHHILFGDQIKNNYMGSHVARMVEDAYRVWMGRPEGKRQLGRSRRRWEVNIKMDFQEVGCEGMDWIDLVKDTDGRPALVSAVMNIWIS
jgi:hypothetical protein